MKKAIFILVMIVTCLLTLSSCNSDEPETIPTGKLNLLFEFPAQEEYTDITIPEKTSYSWAMNDLDRGWGYSFDYSDFENPLIAQVGNYEIIIISPVISTDANTETRMYGYAKFSISETSMATVNIKIEPKAFPRN